VLLCLAGFVGFIVLIAVVAGLTSGTSVKKAASSQRPTSAGPTATTFTDPNGLACVSADSAGYCPGDDPAPATQAPSTAPALTDSQQQAVESAQGYLSDGQGFSYKGLLQQLTSSYGEGFSKSDAKFAIRYLHPDWDQQAVESARGYMADGQGFSRAGLIQQLTSSYGEGFTEAQAEYAAAKVGL
jgi:hypothetical protein